ncbi:hypothetical protein PFISCL1PPCAC_24934, partial [Pristionchus fissidentatus]
REEINKELRRSAKSTGMNDFCAKATQDAVDSSLQIELETLRERIRRMTTDQASMSSDHRWERDRMRHSHDMEMMDKDSELEDLNWKHRMEL